jgi:hypothetical protein
MPVVVLRMASDRIKLMIEVWDVIPGSPAAARPGPDDESGRGLMLVAAQCDRWSWQTVPGWPGKVVWAELRGSLLGPESTSKGRACIMRHCRHTAAHRALNPRPAVMPVSLS